MSIEGRIAVDASFSDLTTGTNLQSLMRLALTSTDSYTSGKVALITGTCGTAAVTIGVAPTTFRDSSGSLVTFSSVSRFAFAASAAAVCSETAGVGKAISSANSISVTDSRNGNTFGFSVQTYSGTASYTIVIVGT